MSDEELEIRIVRVEPGEEIAGVRRLELHTTRGVIPLIVHAVETMPRAVLCVSGAIGGFDGPARLYPRLGLELPGRGFAVARMNYRIPNDFGECLLDTLASLVFLKSAGSQRATLIGHSFGGAVAINAGTLSDGVISVVAISSQLAGAHPVAELSPKSLLLIHGTADTILPDQSSRILYERAGEPKRLELFNGADHRMNSAGDELFALVRDWIIASGSSVSGSA